jgi:hypothetical protein
MLALWHNVTDVNVKLQKELLETQVLYLDVQELLQTCSAHWANRHAVGTSRKLGL